MRAVILVAAVALGSGCIIENTPNLGSATIYWSFWHSDRLGDFGSTSMSASEVCGLAGVGEIDITLTSPAGIAQPVSTGPCVTGNDVPGAVFLDLEPGTWDYYVAGYRGGVLVFDASGSFAVSDGNDTVVDMSPPLAAKFFDVQVNYTTVACPAGGTIEFSLFDTRYSGPVYSTSAGPNPRVSVPCAASASMVIPSVQAATYDFGPWIQSDAVGPVHYSTCRPTWTQAANASKTITVDLSGTTSPTTFCDFP